jgi:hypothetical protein
MIAVNYHTWEIVYVQDNRSGFSVNAVVRRAFRRGKSRWSRLYFIDHVLHPGQGMLQPEHANWLYLQ